MSYRSTITQANGTSLVEEGLSISIGSGMYVVILNWVLELEYIDLADSSQQDKLKDGMKTGKSGNDICDGMLRVWINQTFATTKILWMRFKIE